MKYLSVHETAINWQISERSVRYYCNSGRVRGAILKGKTWMIPENVNKPHRAFRNSRKIKVLEILKMEMDNQITNRLYEELQVEMTYHSNRIEGSLLTYDQTRYMFETKTIGGDGEISLIDDVIETSNHFKAIDLAIKMANHKLTEALIKEFHFILKSATSDAFKKDFQVGDYKLNQNIVGGNLTAEPSQVKTKIKELLNWYHSLKKVSLEHILEFHFRFERIHPFQDGNGRVGRLIMLKECLKHQIIPSLIKANQKEFYYQGLNEWPTNHEALMNVFLAGQELFKSYLTTFNY